MSDQELRLNNVRLAFGDAIFTAKSGGDGEGKPAFSCTFILPPNHPDLPKVKAALRAAAQSKWGEKGDEILKRLIAGDKVCLRNGDTKSDYDGFAGNMFIAARSNVRPLVIDADRSPLSESDGKPYSGCYVNGKIAVWAQDNKYGKRINAQLQGVQFFRDGDAFGGGRPASVDEFEAVDEGASADGEAPAEGDDPFDSMI
jgi:hypothetical protein